MAIKLPGKSVSTLWTPAGGFNLVAPLAGDDGPLKEEVDTQDSTTTMWLSSSDASVYEVEDVVARLGTDLQSGLQWTEADKRKSMFGGNEFEVKEEDPLYRKYLEQFKNPLILLLLASAFVSICMKQFDDAVSITVAIIIVVTVAFVQVSFPWY